MLERTDADERRVTIRILLVILAVIVAAIYVPLLIAAFVDRAHGVLLLGCLLATAVVLGILVYAILQLCSAKRMQVWGLGIADRLSVFSILLVLANIAAGRAAYGLFVYRHNQCLAYAIWLVWFVSQAAYLLSAVLILCLMVTIGTRWGDTPAIGRAARAFMLLGLLASMWLVQATGLPPDMANTMIPP